MLTARSSKAMRRRCARSPTSGPSPARSIPEIRTGSLSRPKPRTERRLGMVWRSRATVLLLGGIAVTIVLVLLLRGKTVDDEAVSFAQVTFAELDGWQAD